MFHKELVNLLLCGQAVSNVFDDEMKLDSGNGNFTLLKGIKTRCNIGLLSLFEHYNICKVTMLLMLDTLYCSLACTEPDFFLSLRRLDLTWNLPSYQFGLCAVRVISVSSSLSLKNWQRNSGKRKSLICTITMGWPTSRNPLDWQSVSHKFWCTKNKHLLHTCTLRVRDKSVIKASVSLDRSRCCCFCSCSEWQYRQWSHSSIESLHQDQVSSFISAWNLRFSFL